MGLALRDSDVVHATDNIGKSLAAPPWSSKERDGQQTHSNTGNFSYLRLSNFNLLSATPGQFVSLLLTFGIFTWSLNRAPNKTIKYSDSDGRFLNFAFRLFSFYIWYSHWHIFG